jgi:hypothetical protein
MFCYCNIDMFTIYVLLLQHRYVYCICSVTATQICLLYMFCYCNIDMFTVYVLLLQHRCLLYMSCYCTETWLLYMSFYCNIDMVTVYVLLSRLVLGSTQPPVQWVPGLSRG